MSKHSGILDNHNQIKKHVMSISEKNGDTKRDRKNIYEKIKDKKHTEFIKTFMYSSKAQQIPRRTNVKRWIFRHNQTTDGQRQTENLKSSKGKVNAHIYVSIHETMEARSQ